MQRQSKNSAEYTTSPTAAISHSSFVGLGILCDDAADVITVYADLASDGEFVTEIEMAGTGKFRYPTVDGMNVLYNCSFIKVEFDGDSIKVFQKG